MKILLLALAVSAVPQQAVEPVQLNSKQHETALENSYNFTFAIGEGSTTCEWIDRDADGYAECEIVEWDGSTYLFKCIYTEISDSACIQHKKTN